MKQCPECLLLYWEDKDGLCPGCKADVTKPKDWNCPKCRYERQYNGAKFCIHCGADLTWYDLTGTQSQNQSGTPGGTGSPQGEASPQNTTPEEDYSEEDTSKGLEYAGLLTEWVVGFRRWKLDNNVLFGEYQSEFAWKRGLQKADMDHNERGFYAYHDMGGEGGFFVNPLSNQRRASGGTRFWHLVGVIRAKGDLYIYPDGFRAQYAEIVLLGFSDEWQYKDVLAFRGWARREYGCATVEEKELGKAALKYGSPIPKGLIPEEWQDEPDCF